MKPPVTGSKLVSNGLKALSWLAALALLTGCNSPQMRGALTEAPASAATARRPPRELQTVIYELDERRAPLESLAARLKVVLRDRARENDFGLSGVYLGDREGNLRLRLLYQETLLLDVAMRGEQVEIWLPRRERFFRGVRSDLLAAPGSEWALLSQIGNAPDLFFPKAWTPEAVGRRALPGRTADGAEVVEVFERQGKGRACVRRLSLNAQAPVVDGVEVFGRNGARLGGVRYEDYRFPGPLAGERDERQPAGPYPGCVLLEGADGARSLRLELEEVSFNLPLPGAKFEIGAPEGCEVRDLGAALRANRNLWD